MASSMTPLSRTTPLVRTLYMEADLLSTRARITSVGRGIVAHSGPAKNKEYSWIRLNQTIFHPHGGGQLSDKGTIDGHPVAYVHKEHFEGRPFNEIEVQHCFEESVSFQEGQEVQLEVDKGTREENSLWHTAAHVIDYLIVHTYPHLRGHSGQCYPRDAFMKFDKTIPGVPTEDGARAINRLRKEECPTEAEVKQAIKDGLQAVCGLELDVIHEGQIRKLRIGDHPINCGGTHVHSLRELAGLEVASARFDKEGTFRVRYNIV